MDGKNNGPRSVTERNSVSGTIISFYLHKKFNLASLFATEYIVSVKKGKVKKLKNEKILF